MSASPRSEQGYQRGGADVVTMYPRLPVGKSRLGRNVEGVPAWGDGQRDIPAGRDKRRSEVGPATYGAR
jgi:hypothetical protein